MIRKRARLRGVCLLSMLFMSTASCVPYHDISSDEAEVNIASRMDYGALFISGQCANRSDISLPRLRISYVTETVEGTAGPSGMFYIYSGSLNPGRMVDFSHRVKTEKILKLSSWRVVAERPYMGLARIVLIGLLMAGGLAWQIPVMFRDFSNSSKGPTRVIPPIIVSIVLLLGVTVHSLLNVLDDHSQLKWWFVPLGFGKALVLGVLLVVQVYFGPIFVAFMLSCCTFYWLTDGRLHEIPVIQATFHWALSGTPEVVGVAYVILVALYSVGGSLWDGI